ncbi:MAG: 5'/3'-nucleotidase SurE [Dehalococcoidia bacterium]|nr:MAG: 5'/3'-nucleotidase SurE [Dehalococcoidia bacterium]
MQILLTNDDGIFAPGLSAIYPKLAELGEVTVAAPIQSKSGMAHSITIFEPLTCNKIEIEGKFGGYGVHGSPADCVKLAVMELHPEPFDLVVSGINHGANVGLNVCYSGTVAAAIEGAFYRIPSIALSLAMDEEVNFQRAAEDCYEIIKKILPLKHGDVVNVNLPRQSIGEPKGVRVVPQSTKGFHENYVKQKTKQGHTIFQLSGGQHREEDQDSDTTSLAQGYITVTGLHYDMTDYKTTKRLTQIDW